MAVAPVVSAGRIPCRLTVSVTEVPLWPARSLMSSMRTPWALRMDTDRVAQLPGRPALPQPGRQRGPEASVRWLALACGLDRPVAQGYV